MSHPTHAKKDLLKVCEALEARYGQRKFPPFEDFIAALIYQILELGVPEKTARDAEKRIRDEYIDWNDMRVASVREIQDILGLRYHLCRVKAEDLRSLLADLYTAFRRMDLTDLLKTQEGIETLRALPETTLIRQDMVERALLQICNLHTFPCDDEQFQLLKFLGGLPEAMELEEGRKIVEEALTKEEMLRLSRGLREHHDFLVHDDCLEPRPIGYGWDQPDPLGMEVPPRPQLEARPKPKPRPRTQPVPSRQQLPDDALPPELADDFAEDDPFLEDADPGLEPRGSEGKPAEGPHKKPNPPNKIKPAGKPVSAKAKIDPVPQPLPVPSEGALIPSDATKPAKAKVGKAAPPAVGGELPVPPAEAARPAKVAQAKPDKNASAPVASEVAPAAESSAAPVKSGGKKVPAKPSAPPHPAVPAMGESHAIPEPAPAAKADRKPAKPVEPAAEVQPVLSAPAKPVVRPTEGGQIQPVAPAMKKAAAKPEAPAAKPAEVPVVSSEPAPPAAIPAEGHPAPVKPVKKAAAKPVAPVPPVPEPAPMPAPGSQPPAPAAHAELPPAKPPVKTEKKPSQAGPEPAGASVVPAAKPVAKKVAAGKPGKAEAVSAAAAKTDKKPEIKAAKAAVRHPESEAVSEKPAPAKPKGGDEVPAKADQKVAVKQPARSQEPALKDAKPLPGKASAKPVSPKPADKPKPAGAKAKAH